MIQKIKDQIKTIDELLTWLQQNNSDLYEQRFIQLVQERCRLRKIMEAKKENPAIAAYGESQKGKSYLMGNLLQKDGKPFMISLPTGEKINFVRSINPIGKMREATGVVTRFTAFNGRNAERYSKEYPVLMKLLTVSDIALILCDSYYNDLRGDNMHFSDEDIRKRGDSLYARYKDRSIIPGTPLVEDDILDIKIYIKQFLASKAYSLINGVNISIFDKIALIIRRVPEHEWSEVLKFLWHDNEVFTQLFTRLIGAMSRLRFSREVYLPIDAVRHHGVNENTIMSVACLNGLDKPTFNKVTDVYIRTEGQFDTVRDFNKAELCAICAETAYRVDQDYLSTKVKYCLDMLPDETKSKIKSVEIDKDVINVADLLDFPGARNRESIPEEKLRDFDEKEGASNTVKALLRGKVAYLFNKYCSSRAINILMFCHDQMNYNVTDMPFVIDKWVKEYVGKDMEERKNTVSHSDGVPPLFVIATKFNMDMTLDQNNMNSEMNSVDAVNKRWDGRFQEVLYRDCLQAHSVEWFRNWVHEGETFKNTYLLRDFKYSTCSGDGSNLYEGYVEDDENPKEIKLHLPTEFYDRLRNTFIENSIVGKFFEDPSKSWDLATTLNNDGALYIIERLRTVAYAMDSIRDEQFADEIRNSMNAVYKLMESEYEPEKDSDTLLKNIKTARSIVREMDISCQMDMYFFGHLIQTLQIDQTVVYNAVNDFINNADVNNDPEDPYDIICNRCAYFDNCETDNDKIRRFMTVYGFDSEDDANEYIRRRGLKKEILFNRTKVRLSNSAKIATHVYDMWISQLQSNDLLNRLYTQENHDEVALSALTKKLADTAERLNLADHMAKAVAKYLDIVNIHMAKKDLVADVLTHTINSFVCDMGYSLLTAEQVDVIHSVAQQNNITVDKYIGQGIEPLPQEEMISNLFTKMISENQRMTRTFEQNYNEWIEYMYVAFLNGATRIIKNPEANHALGEILRRLK